MALKKGHYIYTGITVEPTMKVRIEQCCDKFKLSKSEIIRRILYAGLPRLERSNSLPAVQQQVKQVQAE